MSLVISSAQYSVRREFHDDDREQSREKMLKERHAIFQSKESIYWNGVEANGIELPLFGVPHCGNRRKLKSSKYIKSFSPEELDVYSIGTGRLAVLGTKSSKKAPKKGSGKGAPGQRPGPRPKPRPPRPPNSQPTPRPPRPPNSQPTPRPPRPPNSQPTPRPPRPPNSQPTPRPPGGCITEINVDFLQLSAIPPALFVNPNDPDEQTLGTRYVYNDGLRDQDTLDELIESKVSGTCTRTQSRVGDETIGLQLGRGNCHFTYVVTDSQNREIVFTASGDVSDSLGGILSITGGSRTTVGAYGEIELLPVNLLSDGEFEIETGDFFLDPLFYLADARIIVPCDYEKHRRTR